jgi:hypothetical protein
VLTTSRGRWLMLLGVSAICGGGTLIACGSDEDVPADIPDGGGDTTVPEGGPQPVVDGEVLTDAGVDANCGDIAPDATVEIDCSGKCGPVRDLCTGTVKNCGGCPNAVALDGGDGGPQTCDLTTNSCGAPKTTCLALGAECGTVKNSCGEYLDCPDTNPKGCPSGKECDPDTHKCRDSQGVTCQDLGYECGSVWLGVGEDTPANYFDCGGCSAQADGGARKCNTVFHTCEPSCVPKSAQVLCDEAKAKKGVECGVISNGCGGTVNCDAVPTYGCKNGESCGVRGIANRCDPKATPDECKAAGKTCGEITSACTGLKIKCGECAAGEVCNPNGVCGAPCAPKTCMDFQQFECGTFDDTCGGTVTCGNCVNGICNNTTKTCCATNNCAGTYAGKCGQDLANGCGQNVLDCNCTGSSCTLDGGASPAPPTSTAGMCCIAKTAANYAGQCGNNLPNGCGQNNVNVTCPNGGLCVNNGTGAPGNAPANGVAGTCCAPTHTCTGQPVCSQIQNSCRPTGTMVTCGTGCSSPQSCNGGTCCTPASCTGNGGENGECNITKPGNGCGADRACNCGGNRTCWCTNHQCIPGTDPAGVCKSALTCTSAAYNNKCGTALTNGIGGVINCGCPTGQVCSTMTPGATGTCGCPAGTPYTCGNVPGGPSSPGGHECGGFDNGCGGSIPCNCPAGETCNTSVNPRVCCTPTSCPQAGIGSACGNVSNGCGGTNPCGCPGGAGNENFTCTAGTCQCVKDTCRGRTGSQPDRCGGSLDCKG